MTERRRPPILLTLGHIVASLALFAGVFLTMFWTPGVLLALFALAYAADSRTLSTALDPATRHAQNVEAARRYAGGWLDSIFRPT
jgi:hypothetical protein